MHKGFEGCLRFPASLWPTIILVSALASPLAAQQNEPGHEKQGAKAIFYNPSSRKSSETKPQKPEGGKILITRTKTAPAKTPALHYWLEMEGVGKTTEDRVFYTGDRLSLHVRGNLDGRLTLWACDSSGNSQLLFPPSTASTASNFIRANTDHTLGVIELSPPAGDERLLIFFSESGEDIPLPQQAALTAEQIKEATGGNADRLVEVEKNDAETFGTYLANRQGGVLAREIRIKHRPRKGVK